MREVDRAARGASFFRARVPKETSELVFLFRARVPGMVSSSGSEFEACIMA